MVSNIDPTKPQTGIDQPVQVIRDNFARAKIEIEELQAGKISITGGTLTGTLRLASFVQSNLPDPTLNPGGLVFVSDVVPAAPFFSNGSTWQSVIEVQVLNDLNDVDVGTPGSSEDGQVLTWNNAAGEFQLNQPNGGFIGVFTVATLPAALANSNNLAFATDASVPGMLFSSGGTWFNSATGAPVTV